MNKVWLFLVTTAILFFPLTSIALAKESKSPDGLRIICERKQHHLAKRLQRREHRHEKRHLWLTRKIDRLNKQIEKAASEGKEVSKIKADLEILNTKTAKLIEDQKALDEAMGQIKEVDCTRGAKSKIKEIQDKTKLLLEKVKAERKDIRHFFQEVIKPDLRTLGV